MNTGNKIGKDSAGMKQMKKIKERNKIIDAMFKGNKYSAYMGYAGRKTTSK